MLSKQNLNINFIQGLDTKTDPFQVQPGKFLSLKNTIFTKGGLLQKRNGFKQLPSLPDTSFGTVTTFNGNLTAIGNKLSAYSENSGQWINKGELQSLDLNVQTLVRSNTNQTQCDSVVSINNIVCTVYIDNNGNSNSYKYTISDYTTGQSLVPPSLIIPTSGTVTGPPRVFLVGNYFIIVFNTLISATNHLEYVAINSNSPTIINSAINISSSYNPIGNPSFDGFVANNNLYLAWNGADGGGAIRVTYLDSHLNLHNTVIFSGHTATLLSVTADTSANTAIIYVSFYSPSTGWVLAVDQTLNTVLAPTEFITSGTVLNLASTAINGIVTEFYEVSNNYGYDSSIPTHFIKTNTITQGGTVGTSSVLVRSVGLASKAFLLNGVSYFLSTYFSLFQPTYFLSNGSGQIIGKLAYSNAGGYLTHGLPNAMLINDFINIAYLYKDLITSVNKSQGVTNAAGIYSQSGINLSSININNTVLDTAEIGNNLNISGGFLWSYDGATPVEQNFHLWADNVEVTTATGSGSITAQEYFYQATYEWTDLQGNIFRSAPSIPVAITTTTSSSTNTINVPTLRLTYKLNNPVKIVLYRWSTAQQNYYQVTSVTVPTLNDPTVDYITITDALSDSSILGNALIYTTGGVIENIAPPATNIMTLFDTRLWLLDSEDRNLLWYSKQVIEGTPVEMSDLFTVYISPTISAQSSTGPITALSVMDDKLIIFKKNAIYYLNGTGPDNTGSNNQYSQPTFISSTIGCTDEESIVFIPQGLLFQSDKGIWLLARDLSTSYIGAAVEEFNTSLVESSLNIPGTNQVRFTLNSNTTLMYDYFYNQWGTFVGIPGISSTLYQGLHTFINSFGQVYQENADSYLDGSNPVLISFTTSWFNLTGLQGYQRAHSFYLLGVYYSPHKLNVEVAYDYNSSPLNSAIISPDNFSPTYGGISPYGQGNYGGVGNLEKWRVFFKKQRCESFQITISEIFDSTKGTIPGEGLTLSGLNLVYASKRGFRTQSNAHSIGVK